MRAFIVLVRIAGGIALTIGAIEFFPALYQVAAWLLVNLLGKKATSMAEISHGYSVFSLIRGVPSAYVVPVAAVIGFSCIPIADWLAAREDRKDDRRKNEKERIAEEEAWHRCLECGSLDTNIEYVKSGFHEESGTRTQTHYHYNRDNELIGKTETPYAGTITRRYDEYACECRGCGRRWTKREFTS
jgi:hypothetical protein